MQRIPLLAPPNALGWTHIWDHGHEQLPVDDALVAALVRLGIVFYSGEYKVYKPVFPFTLERIRDEVIHVAA